MNNALGEIKKVVVIGGGTGTFVVLSGLKDYPIEVAAIIAVTDTGGSTGRLRDEFGFLPVGDLRQGLAALANDKRNAWTNKLLLYRFSQGKGLVGHNLGNLILTALQDITGSTPIALEAAAQIFRLKGKILPITTKNIQLVAEYEDGTVEVGEKALDEKHPGEKIVAVKTSPRAYIYHKAAKAISEADLIVIGPGDLYGSIMANLVVDGVKEAFKEVKGKVVYISNLMTRLTQTHNLSVTDHMRVVEMALNRQFDHVIINTAKVPAKILSHYASQGEYPVADDLMEDNRVIRKPLVKPLEITQATNDYTKRSFIRHDQSLLGKEIVRLLTSKKDG